MTSEASAKRSVTATATDPASRTMNTSPSPVAMWACEAGSAPAASAASISSAPASRQPLSSELAASSSPAPSRIAQPRISGETSLR